MTTITAAELDRTASDIAWDLEPLIQGQGDEGVNRLLDEAERRTQALAVHRGRLASLDPAAFAALMREVAEIFDRLGRVSNYAGLRFAENTEDPTRGALLARVDERSTAISNDLIFVTLEWAALPDERAAALLADDALSFCRHHLVVARRHRPHLLTEPEERILADKGITGRSAWTRLFEELTSAITVSLDGGTMGLEQALARLHSSDREVRREAAEATTAALQPGLRTRAFVLNTLLSDKAIDDRHRRYASWLQSRNLDNEASDESVEALIEAISSRYDIPRRWYALKARMLGLDRLADFDRYASVADSESVHGWKESRELVLDAYRSFSDELASGVKRFFDEPWIDAPVRPGKQTGAFCSYTVPSSHPYVMLNWTGRRRDVLTLAHELGHGIHAYLARGQGIFHQGTPLTIAETASVFGETLTFGKLLEGTTEPNARLALLAESLEGMLATVFRQIAMNRFEQAAHTERRERGELSVERFGELWAETQGRMMGDSVVVTEGYRSWWSYIPHFYALPGYVYAYAYGQLFALSVYREYERRGPSFAPAYLEMLSRGGSVSPEELGRIVGVDLASPTFWEGGLGIIEDRLRATEEAARAAGRLASSAPAPRTAPSA
jgi:oligoendopeptidase F